jgi:hypothetical protein
MFTGWRQPISISGLGRAAGVILRSGGLVFYRFFIGMHCSVTRPRDWIARSALSPRAGRNFFIDRKPRSRCIRCEGSGGSAGIDVIRPGVYNGRAPFT